jgi:hypothetical protein
MFSGGDYAEVERWLRLFVTSHAKRVNPRIEAIVEVGDEREGKSYGVRLRLGDRLSPLIELDYTEAAANRGSLAWCRALAARVQGLARDLMSSAAA